MPRGILTREGIIPIVHDETYLASLELSANTAPKERVYAPSTEGTILEGSDLKELEAILERNKLAFATHPDDFGKTSLMHHYAKLTTEKPINVKNYRSPPPKVRAEIDRETDHLLAAGIIREGDSLYSAPIVLVRKPDQTWRYCTDFRQLNKVTEAVHFPMPNISDSIWAFKDPKVFTSLDLLKGFFQIPVAESHRKYFGFNDGKWQLEYCRTPMGSKNSGATMASLVEILFRGFPCQFLLAYLDDVLLCTPSVSLHLTLLDRVLSAFVRAGLKLNPLKCKFAQDSVASLGFVLSSSGITPDPKNLQKIKDWPAPKNQKHVRQFVGLCSYYRSHLPNFAKIASPLTDLLAKDSEFSWAELEQEAFETLRNKLMSGSACQYPDYGKPFILKCDGSGNSVGAVLSQLDERGKEVIVACSSQKLNQTQTKWSAFDKEYYAIMYGVRSFSHYLKFQKFNIQTDHRPLLTCMNISPKNDSNGKRTRWSLELQGYDFTISYKKGPLNLDADALSRYPNPDPPVTDDLDDLIIVGAVTVHETPIIELSTDCDLQKQLMDAQRKDVLLKEIIDGLLAEQTDGSTSDRKAKRSQNGDGKHYVLVEGLLYVLEKDRSDEMNKARVVVPTSMVELFLNRSHGDMVSGHPGEKRTLAKLSKFAYWPGMRKDVNNKVRTCPVCHGQTCKRGWYPLSRRQPGFPLSSFRLIW